MTVTISKISVTSVRESIGLGELWRQVLEQNNISESELNAKIRVWCIKIKPNVTKRELDIFFYGIRRNLTNMAISWDYFCKGLEIIGIEKITFMIWGILIKVPIAISHAKNSLGDIWEQILKERKITSSTVDEKILVWCSMAKPNLPKKELKVFQNNVGRVMLGTDITWRCLCKRLEIIGIEEITIMF